MLLGEPTHDRHFQVVVWGEAGVAAFALNGHPLTLGAGQQTRDTKAGARTQYSAGRLRFGRTGSEFDEVAAIAIEQRQ